MQTVSYNEKNTTELREARPAHPGPSSVRQSHRPLWIHDLGSFYRNRRCYYPIRILLSVARCAHQRLMKNPRGARNCR